jgi:hypothetical protein
MFAKRFILLPLLITVALVRGRPVEDNSVVEYPIKPWRFNLAGPLTIQGAALPYGGRHFFENEVNYEREAGEFSFF